MTTAWAQVRAELDSPVGRYRPEVLLLAPHTGEDATCLSLVAQCLELGLAIELDEHWRLPTAPPRDLSAYKTCLFPDSARERYDADLNAFNRAGGFLIYNKYYPVDSGGTYGIDHTTNLISFQGRDVMTQQFAAMAMQAGLSTHDPAFIATLRRRPLRSILDDQKQFTAGRYGNVQSQRWSQWKDPDCFFLLSNLLSAQATRDDAWLAMTRAALDAIAAAHADLLRTDRKISSQLENYVEGYVQLFAWAMLLAGARLHEDRYTQVGLTLGRYWHEHNADSEQGHSSRGMRGIGCEDMFAAPGLYWMTRITGEERFAQMADGIVRRSVEACQRPSGIWSHWINHQGEHQSAWCRGTAWPVLTLTGSLAAIDRDSPRARTIRDALARTFDGLAVYQDAASGLWRNVIDEPFTRPETSGTCTYLLAHDLLTQMGLALPRHEAMFARAFEGLLPLCYRQGISAFCRGTDYGPAHYYRCRPMGYSPSSSFFIPTVARRAAVTGA